MTKKGILKKFLLVALTFAVIIVVALLDPDVEQIIPTLQSANSMWLLFAFACIILSYASDGAMFHIICRLMKTPQGMLDGAITTMTGFFYSALTPFQSGGQPMQIIRLRARGVPVGSATSTMVVKFLAWQFSAFGVATAGLIVMDQNIALVNAGTKTLIYVGWALNLAILLIVFFALLYPSGILSIGKRLLAFLHCHRIILRKAERYEKVDATWERTISDYGTATKFLLASKLKALPIFLFGLLEVVFYMLVTYCIYRAFSLSAYNALQIVLLQSVLTLGVSFIPLPGASIASEGGFYSMFTTVFGSALRFPSLLLWRFFTYYMNILVGLVFVLIDGFRGSKKTPPDDNLLS